MEVFSRENAHIDTLYLFSSAINDMDIYIVLKKVGACMYGVCYSSAYVVSSCIL